jgi:crossover junction endodeoxyribonuclease RusA
MLPFEFIVQGPPVSHQARNRALLQEWRDAVRDAARRRWPGAAPPVATPVQMTLVYFHDGLSVRIDTDNLVKPIQDALKGLVYVDDVWITDTRVRKTDLNGAFRTRGMSRVLADGFCEGREFLYVRIELAPDHQELL